MEHTCEGEDVEGNKMVEEYSWRGTCSSESTGGGEQLGVRVQVEGNM